MWVWRLTWANNFTGLAQDVLIFGSLYIGILIEVPDPVDGVSLGLTAPEPELEGQLGVIRDDVVGRSAAGRSYVDRYPLRVVVQLLQREDLVSHLH